MLPRVTTREPREDEEALLAGNFKQAVVQELAFEPERVQADAFRLPERAVGGKNVRRGGC